MLRRCAASSASICRATTVRSDRTSRMVLSVSAWSASDSPGFRSARQLHESTAHGRLSIPSAAVGRAAAMLRRIAGRRQQRHARDLDPDAINLTNTDRSFSAPVFARAVSTAAVWQMQATANGTYHALSVRATRVKVRLVLRAIQQSIENLWAGLTIAVVWRTARNSASHRLIAPGRQTNPCH